MGNDRVLFVELLDQIYCDVAVVDFKRAKDLVGKNQNSPPLGEADGSFTEDEWTAARDAVDALQRFEDTFRRVRRA
jgi:hypothetical protein